MVSLESAAAGASCGPGWSPRWSTPSVPSLTPWCWEASPWRGSLQFLFNKDILSNEWWRQKQCLGRDGGSSRVVLCLRRQEHSLTPLSQGPGSRHRKSCLRGTVTSPPSGEGTAYPGRGIWVSWKVSEEPAPGSHDRGVYRKECLGSCFHKLLSTWSIGKPLLHPSWPLIHKLSRVGQIFVTFLFLLSWFRDGGAV